MTAMSRTPRTHTVRTTTWRHVWLAGIGAIGASVRNVRNARDIAGTAVERFDVLQRRAERAVAGWRQGTRTAG